MEHIGIRRIWLLLVALCTISCSDDDAYYQTNFSHLNDSVTIAIAPYFHNKSAAVSLTFDDGTLEQYLHAVPALDKYGLKGTFFVNGHNIHETQPSYSNCLTYAAVKDMSDRGHEVSNHTFNHVKVTTIPIDSFRIELARNDSAIQVWTGKRPVTFSFPNNSRTQELIDIAMKGRVGVRTFEKGFGQSKNHSSYDSMVSWTKDIIDEHDWGVMMFHGIESGYDYWDEPEQFYGFLEYLNKNEDVWTATFKDVSAYREEYRNSRLELIENGNVIQGKVVMSIDDTLFCHPLTLIVCVNQKEAMFDVMPNQEFVFSCATLQLMNIQ